MSVSIPYRTVAKQCDWLVEVFARPDWFRITWAFPTHRKLFSFKIQSSKESKPEGPPPDDLETEIKEEVAKRDEAGTEDIEAIFALMKKDEQGKTI